MKREDFKTIIRARSAWKIDRRKGNYNLPAGTLKDYVMRLVISQMELDQLGILSSGDLALMSGGEWNEVIKDFDDYTLMPGFAPNEICPFEKMEYRVISLVCEIIGC